MTRTVAVTGFGILSPLGRGASETTAALLAGRSGIVSMRPTWTEAGLRSQVAGFVDACAAARELRAQAGALPVRRRRPRRRGDEGRHRRCRTRDEGDRGPAHGHHPRHGRRREHARCHRARRPPARARRRQGRPLPGPAHHGLVADGEPVDDLPRSRPLLLGDQRMLHVGPCGPHRPRSHPQRPPGPRLRRRRRGRQLLLGERVRRHGRVVHSAQRRAASSLAAARQAARRLRLRGRRGGAGARGAEHRPGTGREDQRDPARRGRVLRRPGHGRAQWHRRRGRHAPGARRCRRRARAHRLHQPARDLDSARRPHRGAGDPQRLRPRAFRPSRPPSR